MLNFLNLSFLIYKTGMIILHRVAMKVKKGHVCKLTGP